MCGVATVARGPSCRCGRPGASEPDGSFDFCFQRPGHHGPTFIASPLPLAGRRHRRNGSGGTSDRGCRLSRPADPARRSVSGRRRRGHARPHHHAQGGAGDRRVDRHRQQTRRRRQRGCGNRRARAARWLRAPLRHERHACDQPEPVPGPALRPCEGFRADRSHDRNRGNARGQPGLSAEIGRRAHPVRKDASRRGQLRVGRQRDDLASRRRTLSDDGRRRHRPCALSRRRARRSGCRGRAGADDDRRDAECLPAGEKRQTPRTRVHDGATLSGGARVPDRRRGRLARLRRHGVGWHLRAGRNARRRHREAQRRDPAGARRPASARDAARTRRAGGAGRPGRSRPPRRGRGGKVGDRSSGSRARR